MNDAIDDLTGALFALDLDGLGTQATTRVITGQIVRWAASRGWAARTEARVRLSDSPRSTARLGLIDVIVRRDGAQPDVAIEIDSTDKRWSLTKLRYASAAGMHAVWVRWGDDVWAGTHDEVDVIQLPALRRSTPRSRSCQQLALWP